MWIIAGIIAGLLMISGVAVFAHVDTESETIECSTCGNSCTAESNCGLETCGAVNGGGSCGCGG